MLRLVLDTAVASCSAALIEDGRPIAARDELIGRGHAERLVPLVAELMAEAGAGRADEILVDVGPGSFTGIRVGVAAARAFGLAWGATVHGFTSTALIAAAARAHGADALLVVLEAGRGELYAQAFGRDGAAGPIEALAPEAALRRAAGRIVAGSGTDSLLALDPSLPVAGPRWPSARDAVLLPPGAAGLPPQPLYVRAPDAKLPR